MHDETVKFEKLNYVYLRVIGAAKINVDITIVHFTF